MALLGFVLSVEGKTLPNKVISKEGLKSAVVATASTIGTGFDYMNIQEVESYFNDTLVFIVPHGMSRRSLVIKAVPYYN